MPPLRTIAGGGLHALCLYERGSVRSPDEATRLMREGCTGARDERDAFSELERDAGAALRGVLSHAEIGRGRIVLAFHSELDRSACERLATVHGFSTYDHTRTNAVVPSFGPHDLVRTLRLLRDPSVGHVELVDGRASVSVFSVRAGLHVRYGTRDARSQDAPVKLFLGSSRPPLDCDSEGDARVLLTRVLSIDVERRTLRVRVFRRLPALVAAACSAPT